MNESVEAFEEQFREVFSEASKLGYMTRAKEIQIDAREKLMSFKAYASHLKQHMISDGDEESANAMLSFEEAIDALINELGMWIALKDDKPDLAWDLLVNAQMAVHTAIQCHPVAQSLEDYSQFLYAAEKVLFPPQQFLSIGAVTLRSSCSICGQEYGECGHIKGRAYMGQMCCEVIEEAEELREVSLVEEPANKHCRVFSTTSDGVTRDWMTGRVIVNTSDHSDRK